MVGDIILLSLRDFQDDKADVIHRYTPDEARNLKTYGELKSDFQINEGAEGECGVRAVERASGAQQSCNCRCTCGLFLKLGGDDVALLE